MDSENARSFDATKPSYERGVRRLPGSTQAAVLRHSIRQLEIQPDDNVLDVCAGAGSNIESIATLVGEDGVVTGVELSGGMLRLAENKVGHQRNVRLVHGDIADLPGYDGCFDKAFMSFCLSAMHLARRIRVIQGVCRMLKGSGTLVIVDYYSILGENHRNRPGAIFADREKAEVHPFLHADLKTVLAEGGFTKIEHVALLGDKLVLVKALKASGAIAMHLQGKQGT
jgi:ubiquinone/menaquinone biosynthesis C-methylase UbiE